MHRSGRASGNDVARALTRPVSLVFLGRVLIPIARTNVRELEINR